MKKSLRLKSLAVLFLAATAGAAPAQPASLPSEGILVIDTSKVPPPTKPVYRAETITTWRAGAEKPTARIDGKIYFLAGPADRAILSLEGAGTVTSVTGKNVEGWAERRDPSGARFLEIVAARPGPAGEAPGRPRKNEAPAVEPARVLEFSVAIDGPAQTVGAEFSPALPGIGEAAGFSGAVAFEPADGWGWEVVSPGGLEATADALKFLTRGGPAPKLRLRPAGSFAPMADLSDVRVEGTWDEATRSVAFVLTGRATAREAGARIPFLRGFAAVTDAGDTGGWALVPTSEGGLDLVAPGAGTRDLRIAGVASAADRDGWRTLDFAVPAATIAEIAIAGLPDGTEFREDARVRLERRGGSAVAWLPASGICDAAWRAASGLADPGSDSLYFTATARTDIRVGPGLVSQDTTLAVRVLQGRMESLEFLLEGRGDVVDAAGTNSNGWEVARDGGKRILRIALSRPVTGEAEFRIRAQSETGAFPAVIEPLRLVPVSGNARLSGLVRIARAGAVRFDVTDGTGLMQVAPARWDDKPDAQPKAKAAPKADGLVYQFPSARYALVLEARQVFPEVAVNQVTVYEIAAADRVIRSSLELDINEAPLRDWEIRIPEGYAVASLTGTEVADFQPGAADGGSRPLRVIFGNPVQGRAVIELRLESGSPAAAGEWDLPAIRFPGAKSVRGFVGVASAPGFRLSAGKTDGLAEAPTGFFPSAPRGLQLAFRQREAGWSARVGVEALGQSVAADLYHLYSLREGAVFGSVVLNYFVVGAPVTEWRLRVPQSAGNLAIDGQDVRSWRREGDEVIVSLDRPALGAATLLATFEHPMPAEGGRIALGTVEPVGASSERGYVQVVSPVQVKSTFTASGTLLGLEASELPPELRLLSTAPSLGVYEYASRPFALELGIEWFPRAETLPQVVDFAKLETRVSGDGQIMTDAKYYVKARGAAPFALALPAGAKLWEARVGGQLATARSEGGRTLVPLPAGGDPESAVEVSLRYGSKAWFPWRVRLAAPTVDAPVLAAEWTASADPGRVLAAGGSPALHASQSVPASGFAWLAGRSGWAWALGGIWVAALVALPRAGSRLARFGAVVLVAGFLVVALAGAAAAMGSGGVARSALQIAVPIAADGREVAVGAWNLPASLATLSLPGLLAVLAGAGLWLAARLRWRGWNPSACWIGWWVISLGVLLQPRGGFWFCLWVAAGAAVVLVPRLRGLWAAAALAVSLSVAGAAPPAGLVSLEESCVLREGSAEVEARFVLDVKDPAGSAAFILGDTGVPTAFSGDGLTLRKIADTGGGRAGYYVSAPRPGRFAGTLRYTFPISAIGGQWKLPGGPAAARTLSVRVDEPGWMFSSPSAVRVADLDGLPSGASGARLTLLPSEAVVLEVRPVKRDPSRESLGYFASSNQLIVPGPGVVRGRADMRINVSRGEMRELRVVLPKGFLLESVGGKIFTEAPQWNFDPATREARIALPAARRGEFSVRLDFQKPSGNLPGELTVEPVRAGGAEREGGLLALAFPGDAQPGALVPEKLTPVNFEDFPSPLPEIGDGQPVLHRVFRFEGTAGRLGLRVLPVEPEIRASVAQSLSVGSERCVLSVKLVADIRRSAIFRVSFPIPTGWEIESASGDSLAQWIETGAGADRKGVFQLAGRTSGEQSFAITLVAPGVPSSASWPVPRIILDGAARTEGSLVVTPERGLRLQPVARANCSPADPREAGDLQPGALAFRILQQDWKLDLAIEPMEPWITAQSLEDVEIREGQIRHSADILFRADHAAIKSAKIRIPGLDDEARKTVRIEGEAVADFAPAGTDTWEIRFRRGMLGEIPVSVEFQRRANPGDGSFAFQPVLPEGTRQTTAFAALRATGRLEIPPPALPAGWESAEWNAVPAALKSDAAPPSACLRVAAGGGPLTVAFRRQEIADALKLRVAQGEFATVFSPRGDSATVGRLGVRVNEKSTMRVSLPEQARLVRIAVNGEDTQAVKDGADYLFYVVPPSDATQPSAVEIAYGVPGGRGGHTRVALRAPGFNAPLENLTWRVSLPDGWSLRGQSGDLELSRQSGPRRFSINDYLASSSAARDARAREASELIAKAGEYLREGDQGQARAALNKAAKTRGIDEATNEDARVRLQNLASQQAVLGLNTRRQKLYLDNALEDAPNDQLAQAARANPLLQGQAEIAPAQVEQVLQGNTLEEAGALRRLADRLVSVQLAAEPAPVAVAPTLPEAGETLTFTRGLQVDGSRPLGLKISIERNDATPLGFALLLCAATGLAAWSSRKRTL